MPPNIQDKTHTQLAWLAPLLPGAAHAVASMAVGAPFETIKTRLQVGMYSSTWHCARSTFREGPFALYRGALMPLVALVVKRPLEFAAFEWCNTQLGANAKGPVVGGFVAGIISAVLGCPFNVVKVQMQASRKDIYRHSLQAWIDVWRSRGFVGFYKGLDASFIFSVPATTFYLGTYGILREALPPSTWAHAFAGMAASLMMWTVMLPLDKVRTVIQATPMKSESPVTNWWVNFREVLSSRGFRGLWVGWSAVAIRAPVASACSMVAYEKTRQFADAWLQTS